MECGSLLPLCNREPFPSSVPSSVLSAVLSARGQAKAEGPAKAEAPANEDAAGQAAAGRRASNCAFFRLYPTYENITRRQNHPPAPSPRLAHEGPAGASLPSTPARQNTHLPQEHGHPGKFELYCHGPSRSHCGYCEFEYFCPAICRDRSVPRRFCHRWTRRDADGMVILICVYLRESVAQFFGCGGPRWAFCAFLRPN